MTPMGARVFRISAGRRRSGCHGIEGVRSSGAHAFGSSRIGPVMTDLRAYSDQVLSGMLGGCPAHCFFNAIDRVPTTTTYRT